MRKHYILSLNIPEESKFNELEFIQETIRPIPNGIGIAMREIYPPKDEEEKETSAPAPVEPSSFKKSEMIAKVKNVLEGLEDPYPRDIFPEIKEKEFVEINSYLQEHHKFSLDRLSGHIMRIARKNFKQEVLDKIKEEIE